MNEPGMSTGHPPSLLEGQQPQAAGLGGTAGSTAARRKFATPPVKIACLACRASRTRCDGGKPLCTSCKVRARECVYRPSRRGGARHRKPKAPREGLDQLHLHDVPFASPDPIRVESYIDTGAGLAQLQDLEWLQDSDFIFDSLMASINNGIGLEGGVEPLPEVSLPPIPMVRTYDNDASLLEAYYVFIHPYFPMLPPPTRIPQDRPVPRLQNQLGDPDDGGAFFEPTSSLGLAIAAMLALIPCTQDPGPSSQESVLFRRRYAQYLAQAAIETVEDENEMPESSLSPQKALEESSSPTGDLDQASPSAQAGPGSHAAQPRFHPGVPRELESIAALDLLSVYEYAQRGNIKKMQSRAGQALVAAMAQRLHSTAVEDEFSEARRRVWWMTYVSVSHGSIVGNCAPTFEEFLPSFKTKFPTIRSDPEAFAVFIQGQQAMIASTQFLVELNDVMNNSKDPTHLYEMMRSLERFLEPLNTVFESWVLPSHVMAPVDPTEEVLGRSFRAMARVKLASARIKLHRYCAFFDTPIFTGRHCDLKPISAMPAEASDSSHHHAPQEARPWPACACMSQSSSSATVSTKSTSPTSFSHGSAAAGTSGEALVGALPSNNSHYAHPLAPYTFVMPSNHAVPTGGMPSMSNIGNHDNNGSGGGSGGGAELGNTPGAFHTAFPFTTHESSRICLLSALNLAQALDDIPYPVPNPVPPLSSVPGQQISPDNDGLTNIGLNMSFDLPDLTMDFTTTATGNHNWGFLQEPGGNSSGSGGNNPLFFQPYAQPLQPPVPLVLPPRTMPSFACCTMQCAYALLMVHRRTAAVYYGGSRGDDGTRVAGGNGGGAGLGGGMPLAALGAGAGTTPGGSDAAGQSLAGALLVKLQQGLVSVLASLENYALAFEAMGGMRDQVRTAMEQIMATGT